MSDDTLIKACASTAETAEQALGWIRDARNERLVGQERPSLERGFRSAGYQAHRLARSVARPMCVGVFGPSQAGKSYLVSVLARTGDSLFALFDDPAQPEVDFISQINPYGEKEATGLVTRFSVHRTATPPGFPVVLGLLTQTDLVKILANSFYIDGDQQEEQPPTPDGIDRHLAGFEAQVGADYADILREEDVWDLEEYFQRQLRRSETRIFGPYWDRMARCAPRLGLRARAELFSILWGRHAPLTELFLVLLESLSRLGFADEAFCKLDALVPAANGILNVETLAGLGDPAAIATEIRTRNGQPIPLPRPVVTALTGELRIQLKDRAWPFLEHTDLLDFPGYRSRPVFNLRRYLADAKGGALKELFLRGKVDYLFQRYTAEQELTSMLLCLKPSNLDVPTLPPVIEDWIGVTHGRTPEDRRDQPDLLFFILTMFDMHLVEKAGDEGVDTGLRFQARMDASLLKPFAKLSDSWPQAWKAPDIPFRNCFWIRNPNIKAEHVIAYEGRRELRVLEHKVARIAEIRAGYAAVPEVKAHFQDPLAAFDEAMRLNDGGVSYLAAHLGQVCKPGIKVGQVRARLTGLRRQMARLLAGRYVPTDAEKRLAERTAVAEGVIQGFDECLSRNRFGTFLRGLCVDRARLSDVLYEVRTRGGDEQVEPDPSRTRTNRPSMLDLVRAGRSGSAATTGPVPAKPVRSSRLDGLARAAMQLWAETLDELGEDEVFAAANGVPRDMLKEIATELLASSRHLGLEASLRDALSRTSHFGTASQAVAKATVLTERLIGQFVTGLGSTAQRPAVFDTSGMKAEPADFHQAFAFGWLRAFFENAEANARSVDGIVQDPEQNLRLGHILERLA